MDYKNYTEKKDSGLVELVKAGGGYAFAKKKFNSETGQLEEPEITSVDLDKLNERKNYLQNEISEIDALISDINKLG